MTVAPWEFWIDVGGTFTDCLAKSPSGTLRRHKLLSSGVTKGRIGSGSSPTAIVDPTRQADSQNFWTGWQLSLVDAHAYELSRTTITTFDAVTGTMNLATSLPELEVGTAYELHCDLDAPVIAIRYLLGLPLAADVPPVVLRLGTTRGTNALLTRNGARTALVTTPGFGDVLEIGYQARPRLFDLTIHKPAALATAVVEVDERVTYDGQVLQAPDPTLVRKQLQALIESGIQSIATCFLHADRHPAHEQLVDEIAREVGFTEISLSHSVAPLPKFVARADTTVVDAYLNPVLRDYVERLAVALPGSMIRILTSAGGLVGASHFCGKDSILSGPAGGVVGYSHVARAAGFARAIGFDMGGTSTDVSRYDGRFDLEYETQKAGVRLVAPTMAIETVAAGGGSICRFDGVKLTVGPESAGAHPGPACYGRGGPLTVTDLNLLLGRIIAERFPFTLDTNAAKARLEDLARTARIDSEAPNALEQLAEGLIRIADTNMAATIRSVTVAKGADPADYVLVAFGGAAGQHACAVAKELGIRKVLNHPQAGVLSALGIGLADVVRHRSIGIERTLSSESLTVAKQQLNQLEQAASADVLAEGVDRLSVIRSLDIRYRGVESCLTIIWPKDDGFEDAFTAEHRRRYGYAHEGRPLEILAARVEVMGSIGDTLPSSQPAAPSRPVAAHNTNVFAEGHWRSVSLYNRDELAAGDHFAGPAIVTEEISTTFVGAGWEVEVLTQGELLLTDQSDSRQPAELVSESSADADPIFLEIFNNQLASIAGQMGVTLRNTASSVNVKERLDFSCAIFTPDGRLVASAPHVPVHLGAMEETVRSTIAANPDLKPGDVIVTNDPYAGGSHLPDVTVVTPVHNAATGELRFFTASRAHHAEIGGIVPGSMAAMSTNLAEEGMLIQNLKIVDAGEPRFDTLREQLLGGTYPTRDVETNLADVMAQVAANRQGANDLLTTVDRYTWPVVRDYMQFVQDAAERKVRQALGRFSRGVHSYTDYLETSDGQSTPIRASITIHEPDAKWAATIDFTGTGPVMAGNLNANRAIVTAAVIYTLRLLVDEDIPLNHGVLRPIDILLPRCLLNPQAGQSPETTPAVAGGNVETSQRVVDVLLGALGVAAASQGTMNNVVLGDTTFGYYETICGGSGATPEGPGASAVQVHMTNTRLTDPELLERRHPLRVREFSIRRGSGGNGKHRGGDGVVRRLEFLRPVSLSLLTQRRGPHAPYGMAGGEPGKLGANRIIRADGSTIELGGITQLDVQVGDILVVKTPGGGGYGTLE